MGNIIFPLQTDENYLRDAIYHNDTEEIRYVLDCITNGGQATSLSVDSLTSLSLLLEIASMREGAMLLKEEIGRMLIDYTSSYVSLSDFLFFFLGRCRYSGRYDIMPDASILSTVGDETEVREYDDSFASEIASLDRAEFMSYCHYFVEQIRNQEATNVYDPKIAAPIIQRIYNFDAATIPRELVLLYMSINLSINS